MGKKRKSKSDPRGVNPAGSSDLPQPKRTYPERTCVACRGKFPQSTLLRVRKTVQGWTLEGKAGSRGQSGRSCYVCAKLHCQQEKKLRRAFGTRAAELSQHLQAHTQAHTQVITQSVTGVFVETLET
jgi:predicted RNA-binding protein YlxR (DUF448 family)